MAFSYWIRNCILRGSPRGAFFHEQWAVGVSQFRFRQVPLLRAVLGISFTVHPWPNRLLPAASNSAIDGFTANVLRGEKICLMGRNGAGKTTLLKSLLSNYPGLADKDFTLDSASVFWGHEAQIGYFPQDVGATIEHGLTVVGAFCRGNKRRDGGQRSLTGCPETWERHFYVST